MKIHTIELTKFSFEGTYCTDWNDWDDEIFWVPIRYYNNGTRLTL